MFILINDKETLNSNHIWLDRFENELYIPNFPNENEREPLDNIKQRILESGYPKTSITLLIDNEKLVGGCIIDGYEDCDSIEPIYLVINKDMRNRGYGRCLLEESISNINYAKHVFLEVDDPETIVDESYITIDPRKRLNMYLHWGFKVLNFNYIQPPLSEDAKSEENLLLLYKGDNLNKNDLKNFLFHFYKGLCAEKSEDLITMYNEIDGIENIF
jgi:GNAT superfamily N-acetyltransferase